MGRTRDKDQVNQVISHLMPVRDKIKKIYVGTSGQRNWGRLQINIVFTITSNRQVPPTPDHRIKGAVQPGVDPGRVNTGGGSRGSKHNNLLP